MPCTYMLRRALDCTIGSEVPGGTCTRGQPTSSAPGEERGLRPEPPGERVPVRVIDITLSANVPLFMRFSR